MNNFTKGFTGAAERSWEIVCSFFSSSWINTELTGQIVFFCVIALIIAVLVLLFKVEE